MVYRHVYSKVITVNNDGNTTLLCCRDGMCACSSLYNALNFTENNTVVNITSHSVLLNAFVHIGLRQKQRLNNITITGNNGAVVMYNNTGTILCDMCSNVTIEAITWDRCGDITNPNTGGVVLNSTSNISIINCTFQYFTMSCTTVYLSYPAGDINLINSKFMFNTVSNASLCETFYSSLLIFQATSNIFINNSLFYSNGNTNQQSDSLNGSLLYFSSYTHQKTVSILIKKTKFVSNGIRGVYIDYTAQQTKVTLDTVNVSSNNQGVLYNGYGDDILLEIFSSFFAFNSNGALNINLAGNYTINVEMYNTTFIKNKGKDDTLSTAIYALLISPDCTISTLFCSFFSNTGGNSIAQFSTQQGAFPLYSIILIIKSCSFISNKIGSSLHLTNCLLKLYSSALFQGNSARSGAAIYIAQTSQITVDDGSTVQFINNTASLRGGAIYIDLTNCYDRGIVFTNITRYDTISFINNSAKLSGNSMYFNIPNSCDVVSDYSKNNSAAYAPYKFNYTQSRSIIGPPISTSSYEINLCSPAKCGFKNGTECVIKNHKMLGQSIYFNATVCGYFSAGAETTQFQVNFVNFKFKYKLLKGRILVQNASTDRINLLSVGADRDLENDSNIILNVSSLLSSEYRQLTATLSLTLSSCYNGYSFSRQSQQCECYNKDDYIQCEGDSASIKLGYWFGVLAGKHTFSVCHNDYCNFFTHRKETRNGFYNLPAETDDQCSPYRTGVACGQCSEGYTLAYNSPDCISVDKCSPGMIVLVLVLTALYWVAIVSMLFGITYYLKTKAKVSLGYLYGIMYFYSTVDILLTSNLYITDKVFYTVSTLSSFTKLNPQFLGKLCFTNNLDAIDQQFIHYCHMMFILMILIGITITAKFCKTIAFYTDRCIVQVVCLFLLLSYSSLTSISLVLLRPLKFDKIDTLYTYLSPHIQYFSK